jgi:hypothetical protein
MLINVSRISVRAARFCERDYPFLPAIPEDIANALPRLAFSPAKFA